MLHLHRKSCFWTNCVNLF